MRTILGSYRWRRRLVWAGAGLAVVVAFAVAIVLLPNGGGRKQLPVRENEPAQVYKEQKTVRVTAAQRREVNDTLEAFIRTGVTRGDPAAAWELVTPSMRSGISRSDWNRGQLPVFPYPARIPKRLEWNVITSYKSDLTVDLLLQPKPHTKWGPVAFAVELKRGRGGRWLVDSVVPEHIFTKAQEHPKKAKPTRPQPLPKPEYPHGRLSPLWFAIPGSILALIVLVPLVVVLLSWRRQRTIERRYRAERGL